MKLQPLKIRPGIWIAICCILAIAFFAIVEYVNTDIGQSLPKTVDFNFHIRPILSNNCFTCHGPDENTREAGLRLDTYQGATTLLKSGHRAIVPGKVKTSALINRLTSKDESFQMPPPSSNKKLTKREIKLIKKWINQGAIWKKHWALIPPVDPFSNNKLSKTKTHPIDRLIQAKLKENGLIQGPLASKEQLIRRLAFNLTGLPPEPTDTTFGGDYEKLVDHYLQSPHFGERWARHWMDLVRYADTRGHEYDYPVIGAWHYRDYLIRAFNADLPYDQFVTEQLAGDLIQPRFHPKEGFNETILGTAFFALGEGKHSPVDIRKEEVDRIDNIIDVCSKTFQALTVSCARCHDHKFDPIPTADYYALYGIFESTRFSIQPARTTTNQLQLIDTLQEVSNGVKKWFENKFSASIKNPNVVLTSFPANQSLKKDTSFQILGDFRNGDLNGWFPQGLAFSASNAQGSPVWDQKTGQLKEFVHDRISSRYYGKGMVGALRSPTFIIEKDKLLVRAAGQSAKIRIIIDNFQIIRFPIYEGLQQDVIHEEIKDYVFDLSAWKGKKAYIELANGLYPENQIYSIPDDAWLEAEYALSFSGDKPPKLEFANLVNHQKFRKLNQRLAHGFLPDNLVSKAEQLQKINAIGQKLRDTTFFIGVTPGDRIESPVFYRGDHNQPREALQKHRFLSCLSDTVMMYSPQKDSRLQLATSITNSANPLTARVYVNRVWHHLFGRGIVETVDNFGLQGSIPSHPELLDHLAIWFMENGWSTKALIKYIVSSNTFQASTTASAKSTVRDPENKLLQHYPIRRLEAEAIRDAILVTSGCFDSTMFGPSVPIHLTEFMKGRGRPAESGPLDGDCRRSIYLSIRRNFLPPFLLAFDMPVPFSTFGKRNNSNVPAQSLTLMNDPFVAEQAEIWATKVMTESKDITERIHLLFQDAFFRKATEEELKTAHDFLQRQSAIYQMEEQQIENNLALWTDFCHSLFNMKGFIYLI